MTYELIANYGAQALHWILGLLAVGAGWLLLHLIKSATVQAAMRSAGTAVQHAVEDVAATYVDELKASSADGIITPAEAAKAKADAIAKAKSYLSWAELLTLGGGLLKALFSGTSFGAKVEAALGSMVETAVSASKRADAVAGVAPAPAPAGPAKASPPPLPQ